MIISHIELTNWKNFRQADVELGNRVFLIGPNASGKSNFLDALLFLRDIARDGLGKAVASRGGMGHIRCLAARGVSEVCLRVTLDGRWKYELVLSRQRKSAKKHLPLVVAELVYHDGTMILQRPDEEDKTDDERLTQTALEQVSANKDFREVVNFFESIVYRHIVPQAVRDPKGFSSGPIADDPFGRDIVLQIWNTPSKLRQGRLKKLNEALQLAVPNLDNLSVEMDQTSGQPHLTAIYKHWRPNGAYQDEASFSDGTLRLLALLWSFLEPGGPLLLEEPELSLHEEVVQGLASLFYHLTRGKNRRQLFISTHSHTLLSDKGIGANETIWLYPTENGTELKRPDEQDRQMLSEGLSIADVVLPKTRPDRIQQLSLLSL